MDFMSGGVIHHFVFKLLGEGQNRCAGKSMHGPEWPSGV